LKFQVRVAVFLALFFCLREVLSCRNYLFEYNQFIYIIIYRRDLDTIKTLDETLLDGEV